MKPKNEHTRIRAISIGMLLVAIVPYLLGITHINTNLYLIFNDLGSSLLYKNLGFGMAGCLLPYFASRRGWKEYAVVLMLGFISAVFVWFSHPPAWSFPFWSVKNLMISSLGFGLASMAMIFFNKGRGPESELTRQKLIDFYVFVTLLQFSAYTLLSLTVVLHPRTFDGVAYLIDAGFGFNPSVLVAKIHATHHWFAVILNAGYEWGLWGVALVFAFQLRQTRTPPANLLMVWSISVPCALIAYHFCPVAGPVFFFGKEYFPHAMPALEQISGLAASSGITYRNGFPSMHFGTCLIVLFAARYEKSWLLKCFLYALSASVLLATLGLGEHYLIDLVGSFPFIVAIQSFCTRVDQSGQRYRIEAIVTGIAAWFIWVVLIRNGLGLFQAIPGLVWVISAITIAMSLYAYSRIWPHEVWGSVGVQNNVEEQKFGRADIPVMLFILGFTGMVYAIILYKRMALITGDSFFVSTTVHGLCLAGLATGAWLSRKIMIRTSKKPLLLVAVSQFLVGLYCFLSPVFIPQIQILYIGMARGLTSNVQAALLQIFCNATVLFIPSILMGMAISPMLTRLVAARPVTENVFATLYVSITSGAALAALLLGYAILPLLGLKTGLSLSAAASLVVALFALNLHKENEADPLAKSNQAGQQWLNESELDSKQAGVFLAVLFLMGSVVALTLIGYTQLLIVVAGSSSYVALLILFLALLSSGTGALLANRLRVLALPRELIVSLLLFALAGVLLGSAFQWDALPGRFADYSTYPYPLNFYGQQAVRAFVCATMLVPPSVLAGACVALLFDMVVAPRLHMHNSGHAVWAHITGIIIAAAGCSVLMIAIPEIQKIIQFAAVLCIIAGLISAASGHHLKHWSVLCPLALLLVLFGLQPASLNYTELSSGSQVYFSSPQYGTVIDHAMSLETGLTAVAVNPQGDAAKTRTLLANGSFEGDDSGNLKSQLKSALTPLLQSPARVNALVIGYGTGFYANVIKQAGFRHIDIVERNQDLMALSNKYFSELNGRVSEQQGVATLIGDGRNYLALSNKKYDLIATNVTLIWVFGNAAFYNREFYDLAAQRLSDAGVFEQGIQLHHLTPAVLACLLSTVRSVFPYVALYSAGDEARIIASKKSFGDSAARISELMQAEPGLATMFALADLSINDFKVEPVLWPYQVNSLVDAYRNSRDFVISTDDNANLEYATPKENSMDSAASMDQLNLFLSQLKTR